MAFSYRKVQPPDLSRPRPHGIVSVTTGNVGELPMDEVLSGIGYEVDCNADYEIQTGDCGDVGPADPDFTLVKTRRDPFTVSVADICWFGFTQAQQIARARSRLIRLEQAAIADALAGNGLRQSFGALPAGEVEIPGNTPVSLACALGLVDGFGAFHGFPMVAYAPIESSASWPADALTDQSGVLTSRGGTRVALVPHIGQTAPQGTAIDAPWWLWATGPIRLFRSVIEDSWQSDPTDNRYIARAHRAIIPDWTCAAIAVPVTDFCPPIP